MGSAGSRRRARWLVLPLIASGLLWLLVSLTSASNPGRPSVPEAPDRAASTPHLPRPDSVEDDPCFSRCIEGRVQRAGEGISARVTLQVFKRFPGRPLRRVRADADGRFSFDGVSAGVHEISASGPDGVKISRSVDVTAGVDPEFIELTLPSGEPSLRGRALHADGRPFSGRVEARRHRGRELFSATVRTDGRFVFFGLPAGRYTVHFRAGRSFYARAPSMDLPSASELRFVVDEGATVIRGRVFDLASDDPVSGAEVEIWCDNASVPNLYRQIRSDADGRFSARIVTTGGRLRELVVKADGYRPWRLCRCPVAGGVEVGLEPSARLTVKVVAAGDGAPVQNVPVRAAFRPLPDSDNQETRLTDDHGIAFFSSIPGDSVQLSVCGHGYISDRRKQPQEHQGFSIAPGEEREVELIVTRSAVLMGRVTTAAGDPVDGCWVNYWNAGLSGNESLYRGHEFLLPDLLPGDFYIRPSRRGLGGEKISGTLLPGEVRRLVLLLQVGAWLHAEVRAEETGEPIEGARVSLSCGGQKQTGASGQVRLGPFSPQEMTAVVTCPGYLTSRPSVEFERGRTTPLIVNLSRGLSVGGRVFLSDGEPASGARVHFSGAGLSLPQSDATAGDDGTFFMGGLPPGRVTATVSLPGGDSHYYWCRKHLVTGTMDAALVLKRKERVKNRTASLVVTDEAGTPVPRADFVVFVFDAAGGQIGREDGEIVTGLGDFEINPRSTDLRLYVHGARRPGSVPLPLGAASYGPYPASVKRIEVALPAEQVITGRVVDSAGRGLPGIEIVGAMTTRSSPKVTHRFPWHARSRADGTFVMGGLGAGMVTLDARSPNEIVHPCPITVRAGERDVIIRLDALVSVAVTVVDAQGNPLENARIIVWNQDRFQAEGGNARTVADGRTDARGYRRLRHLPETTRHVLIISPKGHRDLAPLRIDGWIPRDSRFTLTPARAISGRVYRADGTPGCSEGGTLWTWGHANGWNSTGIDDDGTFSTGEFAEGRIALAWIPESDVGYQEPLHEPDRYDWPITWVTAGETDIVFRIPAR